MPLVIVTDGLRYIAKLDQIVSEFETEEEAGAYDKWFRVKVEAALDDPRPGIPHDEVMAEMHKLIAQKSGKKR